MSARVCHFCRRPEALRRKLVAQGGNGAGPLYCKTCTDDLLAGRPGGTTVALRSFAVKSLACQHCGAPRGQLCTGPGVVRFIHARRRDAAAELQRGLREDIAHGN